MDTSELRFKAVLLNNEVKLLSIHVAYKKKTDHNLKHILEIIDYMTL